jgi:hypothetical protein
MSSTSPQINFSATDNTTTFTINDASGNDLFELRDYATAVQSVASAGAFISHLSYIGQEFNSDTVNPNSTTTSTTTNAFVGDDGLWNFRTNSTSGTYSITNSVNGLIRVQTTGAGTVGSLLSLGRATTTGTAQNTIVLKANLPIMQMKFVPVETGGTLSATQDYFIGLMNATTTFTTNDQAPHDGIYLWTNNAAQADGATFTLQGVVRSGGANVGTVSCAGTYTFGRSITARIQVESSTSVRFLVDFDASDGISWTDCGAVSGANPTAALAPQFYTVHTVNATRRFDLDYMRIWQDDSITPLEAPTVDPLSTATDTSSTTEAVIVDAPTTPSLTELVADRIRGTLELITPTVLTNKLSAATSSDITVALDTTNAFVITSTDIDKAITLNGNGDATFKGTLTSGNLTVTNGITTTGVNTFNGQTQVHGDLAVISPETNILVADIANNRVTVGTSTGDATFFVQAFGSNKAFAVTSSTSESILEVLANGNIGIGTDAATSSLTIVAKQGVNAFTIASSSGDTFFTVTDSGFVGIGTTTASELLDVWGGLRVGKENTPTLIVNAHTNVVGLGNDGTALNGEKLRVSGNIRVAAIDVDTAASLAEMFPASEALDAGTVVAFSTSTVAWNATDASSTDDIYHMSTVRKAQSSTEAVGVVSTRSGILLGASTTDGVPVAFSGRVPVKVTTENGEIKQGDYLTVSATVPGYAMKLIGEGRAIGRALSDYEPGHEKVLMLVENGNQKLDVFGKNATTTGLLTTGNIDLNANGVAITNIKSLASANGTWSIDENGRVVAKVLCLDDVCIDKSTLNNILNASGQQAVPFTGTSTTQTTSSSTGEGVNSTTTPTTSDTSSSTISTSGSDGGGGTSTTTQEGVTPVDSSPQDIVPIDSGTPTDQTPTP